MRPRGAGQRVDGAADYVERRCDPKESVQSLERNRCSLSLFDDVLMHGVTAGLTLSLIFAVWSLNLIRVSR